MNRIHTYLRNRLGVATLNNLMCICSLGPSIMNFDPKLILAKWLEAPFMQKNGRARSLQGKLNASWALALVKLGIAPINKSAQLNINFA